MENKLDLITIANKSVRNEKTEDNSLKRGKLLNKGLKICPVKWLIPLVF